MSTHSEEEVCRGRDDTVIVEDSRKEFEVAESVVDPMCCPREVRTQAGGCL